jgi:splicing suppressor protein 51
VSKLLTYPITIAGVLHQNGPYTHGNGRITAQGRRSMAAVHSVLHLPPGASEETTPIRPQPPFRIFLLGARAESTLPPHIWEQLTHIFPRTNFNIYFIGPEVGLPLLEKPRDRAFTEEEFGVPAYTFNTSPRLRLTSIRADYQDVHEQLGPFDPYSDVFFAFSPGLGFPDQGQHAAEVEAEAASEAEGEGEGETSTPQALVQAQTGWRQPLRQIINTKCPLFFTAFSPLDLQRDVAALFGTAPPSPGPDTPPEFPGITLPTQPVRIDGVTDEFELVLTPGKNEFGSLKWEIAEWDVRVGVKTNWGLWGIRGKRYEVMS